MTFLIVSPPLDAVVAACYGLILLTLYCDPNSVFAVAPFLSILVTRPRVVPFRRLLPIVPHVRHSIVCPVGVDPASC